MRIRGDNASSRVEEEFKSELQRAYELRFRPAPQFRDQVWKTLTRDFCQPLIPESSRVLDLGCGWGEFIL